MSSKSGPVIAITGAGGFVGSKLVTYFSTQGWRVRALVRDPASYAKNSTVDYVAYDLGKPLSSGTLKGANYLVHAAYIKQSHQHPDAFNDNVSAAQRLLAASREAGVKHNIFISSMSAHQGAVSAYGKQKIAIEQLFTTATDLCLRPGLIIGTGGIVKTMSDFMKTKHVVPLVGGGRQPLQIVNVNNLGPVIEQAIKRNVHGVLTIAHPRTYTYKEFYAKLANSLKVRVFFVPIPLAVLLLVVRVISALRLPLSVNSDNVLGLKKLISVDTRQDLQKLGIELDDVDSSLRDNGF